MFPTRIRYTGMSLPYHIGNGWFGGLLPATVFAMSAAKGDIYYGLWYPIVIAAMTLVIGLIFVRDTKGHRSPRNQVARQTNKSPARVIAPGFLIVQIFRIRQPMP